MGPCDVLKAHLIDRPMSRTVTCFPFSRRFPHAIANDRFFCSSSRTTSQHEMSCLRLHRHSWRPWTQHKILPVAKDGVPPSRLHPESFLPLRSMSQRLLLPREAVRQVWPGWPHALYTQADPEALRLSPYGLAVPCVAHGVPLVRDDFVCSLVTDRDGVMLVASMHDSASDE